MEVSSGIGMQPGQSAAIPEELDPLEQVIAAPNFDTQLCIKVHSLPSPLLEPSGSLISYLCLLLDRHCQRTVPLDVQ